MPGQVGQGLCALSRFCHAPVGPFVSGLLVTPRTGASSVHEISPEEYGVGCHSLLQGIFPTQGLNPHLLHCRQLFYHWATYLQIHWFSHGARKRSVKVTSKHREQVRGREAGWDKSSAGRAWRGPQKPELSARGHRASSDRRDKTQHWQTSKRMQQTGPCLLPGASLLQTGWGSNLHEGKTGAAPTENAPKLTTTQTVYKATSYWVPTKYFM